MSALFVGATALTLGFQLLAGGVTTTSGLEPKPPIFAPPAYEVWVTAYTSSPEETDSTPSITALGTRARDGIVATNMFPFGTRVSIPELFGDRVFVVEDRMHSRKVDFVDIWMSSKHEALRFGINRAKILVLN